MTAPDAIGATSAEWARVARSKYEHYQTLVAEAERSTTAAKEIAIRHHERSIADLVPHLASAIEALLAERVEAAG